MPWKTVLFRFGLREVEIFAGIARPDKTSCDGPRRRHRSDTDNRTAPDIRLIHCIGPRASRACERPGDKVTGTAAL
ncbi:hypothetical protein GCM10011505_09880 [Tistrella bauzanensis]|uniref:Uncharacterized protein n=1 Tax=Tistrella bauzanensis TaxID=657419 RepID=A0ABQ1IBY6_9PROT|nr:hypothetical protein GCM10011505_09880 [Tistrella bauzanensis]